MRQIEPYQMQEAGTFAAAIEGHAGAGLVASTSASSQSFPALAGS
jgi:hypothetical protein